MLTLLASLLVPVATAGDTVDAVTAETLTLKEYRQLARELAAEDPRFRMGRRLHRAGNITTAAGLVAVPVGMTLAFQDCGFFDSCSSATNIAGLGIALGGFAAYASGPVLSSAGALQSAGAIRERGHTVEQGPGWLGMGLAIAGVAVPLTMVPAGTVLSTIEGVDGDLALTMGAASIWLLPPVALMAAHVQVVGPNRHALAGVDSVSVVPMPTRGGGGLALQASF